MPYPNEHAARIKEPDDFKKETFRRDPDGKWVLPGAGLITLPATVDVINGQLKTQPSPNERAVQALRFPTKNWTEAEAKKWLKDNKVDYISFEKASCDKKSDDGQYFTRQATIELSAGKPTSFNREKRTVDVVATTESPVMVPDWETGKMIPEILLMSGLKLPTSRQIPMQDTHDRWTVTSTLGSARDLRVVDDELQATLHFSSVPEAESAMIKVEEGHLTDVSVGWRQLKSVKVPEGQTVNIAGRDFNGPAKVVTSWTVKELSLVPVGADERAKARSEYNETKTTEETEMKITEEIRANLIKLGLKAEATEDETLAFLQEMVSRSAQGVKKETGTDQQDGANKIDFQAAAEGALSAALLKEDTRRDTIRTLCIKHGVDSLADGLITGRKTVDEARDAILNEIDKRMKENNPGIMPRVEFGADAKDKFRSAVIDSLLVRAGKNVDKPAPGHDDFLGYKLSELARECLRAAGQKTGGTVVEMVGRALTTSDIPFITANVANKFLLEGFNTAEETFDIWTTSLPVNDFKAMLLVGVSDIDGLLQVREDGEYKYGYVSDKGEVIQLATYGRIYPISRQSIINDDLSALTTVPMRRGAAAKKIEGDIVYAVLTANGLMTEDGAALFVAAHNNIGTAGIPGTDTMNEMDALFGAKTGIRGEALNIPISFLLAPRGMWGTIEAFFKTIEIFAADGTKQTNIWYDRIKRIYEARLQANSAQIWYCAGPKGTTVVRSHLSGIQVPYLESKLGWTVDGIEYKVRYDVAAAAADWRALARNPGVA